MELLLNQLFDYQKFEGSAALQELIDRVTAKYSGIRELDDDEVFAVSAAGSPEYQNRLRREDT